jgi:multidrug efflux pump subunit AcrA (membrane-fusion protein)
VNATTSRHARFAAKALVQSVTSLAALLIGCRNKAAPAAPPPPEVTVLTVQRQTIPGQFEWVAQAAASKSVQVRAQVSGVIIDRPYVEGTDVARGQGCGSRLILVRHTPSESRFIWSHLKDGTQDPRA